MTSTCANSQKLKRSDKTSISGGKPTVLEPQLLHHECGPSSLRQNEKNMLKDNNAASFVGHPSGNSFKNCADFVFNDVRVHCFVRFQQVYV